MHNRKSCLRKFAPMAALLAVFFAPLAIADEPADGTADAAKLSPERDADGIKPDIDQGKLDGNFEAGTSGSNGPPGTAGSDGGFGSRDGSDSARD